jgi:hypothetical protein
MGTIVVLKEQEAPETPLFLAQCTLTSGQAFYWSTHNVTVGGQVYSGRILKHNLFDLQSSADQATDGISRVSLTLANADSFLSGVESSVGWKGSNLVIQFLFYDLVNAIAASETQVLFNGSANPPDESTESYLRLSFTSRLSLQRVSLPNVRIQKRCPWMFPTNITQLTEAIDGGTEGEFSPFYRCGYSAGVVNGVGNLDNDAPYISCDYTRLQCQQRGMFDTDSNGNVTSRFGGIEFVPSSIVVRPYGKPSLISITLVNEAQYNDFVPLIYGTGWYYPPIVFARNDGNLTHTEVLLGQGPLYAVVKVIVNGVQIPEGVSGANMTATGWYNVFTLGTRSGAFNLDYVDSNGNPLGDPYGSMACMSVVVPNQISNGGSLPEIEVLVQGLQLSTFDSTGAYLADTFTNNPAWVMLDVLRRSGWTLEEINLPSFANAATACNQLVTALDLNGNAVPIPRFQCNLLLTEKRSAGDIVRGIRTGSGLYLTFSPAGLLQVTLEDTIANQQPSQISGSNSTEPLNSGWPAYEFGDSALISGIVRTGNGQSSFTTSARSSADTPNMYTIEFQDEFNDYQQDSLTLVDLNDTLRSPQVSASLTALGISTFDQATRITSLQLNRSVYGNRFIDFETSVKAVDLRPGDIIAITYAKEGWSRQPFRITRIAPGANYRTAAITAQIHDDAWYQAVGEGSSGVGRQAGAGIGLPRPLVGAVLDSYGNAQFSVAETTVATTDGSVEIQLACGFVAPVQTTSAGTGLPLVGLNPEIQTTGGMLNGGQNLYYAVTAVDATGAESALSFVVKAAIPAGTSMNAVTLPTLSFPPSAVSFNVYRGTTPSQLLQIASDLPIATMYTDVGATASLIGPPDPNYDHSNFYWRLELQPEETVDTFSALTIGNSTLGMLPNEFTAATVRILNGTGSTQERSIAGNTATALTITIPWGIIPDATSTFTVSDSSWQFGATGVTSPVTFDVPNRSGVTVEISGRSANVLNEECTYQLCPLTRWQIQGDGGTLLDNDVPPSPAFGVSAVGQGTIEVSGISFSTLNDTLSIAAGTLTLGYWDELNTPSSYSLALALDDVMTTITLQAAAAVNTGDLIQIDDEVMVAAASSAGTAITVTRAGYGTTAIAHNAGVAAYLLEKKTFVMAIAREFFGSPASGSYAFSAYLPDVRIATAELFMTNTLGNSEVTRNEYADASGGLRTLSGGQLSIQVEGILAIQTNVAPPLTMQDSYSVRDVFANISTPPTGSPIQLQVTQNGQTYCSLTIAVGSTVSNVVDGFALGPLTSESLIGLDIVSLTQNSDDAPGSNLTVTIRL